MSYSKLHSSLVNSSLWTEADSVRLLFITLLAMCDREGVVYGSKSGINRLANIEPNDIDMAWDALLSPDPNSSDLMRNPENEGHRIEEIPGGFKLLNFEYYRNLRNDDERREQTRLAQQRFREKSKQPSSSVINSNQQSSNVSPVSQRKPISEADTEADTETVHTPAPSALVSEIEEIYSAYPKKRGKPDALRAIKKALKSHSPESLLERTRAYAATQPKNDRFTPDPAKWFNAERFNDDPQTWAPKSHEKVFKNAAEAKQAEIDEANRLYAEKKRRLGIQ